MNSSTETPGLYYVLRYFHDYFELTTGMISYVLNILVAYLTLTTHSRTLKQYKVVILINVFSDMAYTTFNLLTMIVSFTIDHIWFDFYFRVSKLGSVVCSLYSLVSWLTFLTLIPCG